MFLREQGRKMGYEEEVVKPKNLKIDSKDSN